MAVMLLSSIGNYGPGPPLFKERLAAAGGSRRSRPGEAAAAARLSTARRSFPEKCR
jgi:hypothetical protein